MTTLSLVVVSTTAIIEFLIRAFVASSLILFSIATVLTTFIPLALVLEILIVIGLVLAAILVVEAPVIVLITKSVAV